jgi:ELWxxDGT repeat protein
MSRLHHRVGRAQRVVNCSAQQLEPRMLLASTLAYDFTPGNIGSNPSDFVTLGDSAYFFTRTAANAGPNRPILWKTDGTDAGTTIVKAFDPVQVGSTAVPTWLSAVSGRLFFFAQEPGGGWLNPWVSDGTPDGTHMVMNGFVGTTAAGTQGFVGVGDLAFFNGHIGVNSANWTYVTDGTAEGTRQVPGLSEIFGTEVRNLAVSGARFYSTGRTAGGGIGLFTADGTDGGTRLVHDFGNNGTTFLSHIDSMTDVGGTLYFVAPAAPTAAAGLWKTDGTPQGTVLLKGPGPSPDVAPVSLANVGGTLYFADDGATPGETALWRSDGTEAGTAMVLDRAPGSDVPLRPNQIVDRSGVALFAGTDSAHGTELWRSDGTAAGTYMVADIRPGPDSGLTSAADFHVARDQVFFTAAGADGSELWVTDGTAQGTRRAADLNPGGADFVFRGGTTLGDQLVFSAGTTAQSPEPWVSDGTQAGTHRLAAVLPTPLSSRLLVGPIPVGSDRLLVNADTTVYAVDAANNAVPLLTNVGLAVGAPDGRLGRTGWAPLPDGSVVFAVRTAQSEQLYLYRTDGTPAGTFKLGELNLNFNVTHLGGPELVPFGDYVYFVADETTRESHGPELWRTDGTRAGTTLVRDIVPGFGGSVTGASFESPLLAVAGDRLYFRALTGGRTQLWQTDGTEAGTQLVSASGAGGRWYAGVGDRLFFAAPASSSTGRLALWTSDGTAAGTTEVPKDFSIQSKIVPFGGQAYFVASQTTSGTGILFRSDGTADGTVPLSPPGLAPASEWAIAGGRLYFVSGTDLWTTDGTPGGTVRLLSVTGQLPLVTPRSLTVLGNEVYFISTDAEHGSELWKTDGTPAGTALVEDTWPGPAGSAAWSTAVGNTIYFFANDGISGTELRRLDAAPHATIVARHVFYNHSSFDGNDAAANAADDAAIATDKNALLAGQDRLPGFDNVTSFDRGINGIMIDVKDLPVIDALLDVSDFDFGGAGAPISVNFRPGAGVDGSDRITLIWRDYNPLDTSPLPQAVGNGWLTVTMKANDHTGLTQPDVFRFGNLIGETGDAGATLGWRVNALDLTAVRRALNAAAPITSATDFNRDGRTNALDLTIVKRNLNHALGMPVFAAGPAALPAPPAAATAWREDDAATGLLGESSRNGN